MPIVLVEEGADRDFYLLSKKVPIVLLLQLMCVVGEQVTLEREEEAKARRRSQTEKRRQDELAAQETERRRTEAEKHKRDTDASRRSEEAGPSKSVRPSPKNHARDPGQVPKATRTPSKAVQAPSLKRPSDKAGPSH